MKFVILVPDAHGHVKPTLPLARELAARVHEVIYFLPETFAAVVQVNGATLRPSEPLVNLPSNGSGPLFGLRQSSQGR